MISSFYSNRGYIRHKDYFIKLIMLQHANLCTTKLDLLQLTCKSNSVFISSVHSANFNFMIKTAYKKLKEPKIALITGYKLYQPFAD